MAIGDSEQLLPQSVYKFIGDKLYEKRKTAALEVEQVVKTLSTSGDKNHRIGQIIDKLVSEFASSPQVCCPLLQETGEVNPAPFESLLGYWPEP